MVTMVETKPNRNKNRLNDLFAVWRIIFTVDHNIYKTKKKEKLQYYCKNKRLIFFLTF